MQEQILPTTLTHTIPVIAVGLGLGKDYISKRLIFTGAFIANIPDLDLIAPRFYDFAFDSIYGHRGFSHSIVFAIISSFIFSFFFIKSGFKKAFLFLTFCTLSHGVLDSFTQGGLGIPFIWPLTDIRYYSFAQPIINSGVSFRTLYTTTKAFPIYWSEFIWVWVPFGLIGVALRFNMFNHIKNKFNFK